MARKLPPMRGLDEIKAEAPPATAEAAHGAVDATRARPRGKARRAPAASAGEGTAIPRRESRDRSDEQLSVILPAYVVRQVKARATEERKTLREVVLRALARAGFEVDAADMVDRRAEAARQRAELARIGREALAARERQ